MPKQIPFPVRLLGFEKTLRNASKKIGIDKATIIRSALQDFFASHRTPGEMINAIIAARSQSEDV